MKRAPVLFICQGVIILAKSNVEKQYEKLIIHRIAHLDTNPNHRAMLFLDFYCNGREYYEDLCDLLYSVSCDGLNTSIWLSPSGQIYGGEEKNTSADIHLLDCRDIPPFQGDILEQLDLVFAELYHLIKNSSNTSYCVM